MILTRIVLSDDPSVFFATLAWTIVGVAASVLGFVPFIGLAIGLRKFVDTVRFLRKGATLKNDQPDPSPEPARSGEAERVSVK